MSSSLWLTEPMSANGCQKRVVAVPTAMTRTVSPYPSAAASNARRTGAPLRQGSLGKRDRHAPVERAALRVVRSVLVRVRRDRVRLAVTDRDERARLAAERLDERGLDRLRAPLREPEVVGVRPLGVRVAVDVDRAGLALADAIDHFGDAAARPRAERGLVELEEH